MPTRPSEHADGPPVSSADRIDSWKEIAAHLRRSVPTVQRWEKSEGLPVRRHSHQKQGSIYAYKSELDDWWRERGTHVSAKDDQDPSDRIPEVLDRTWRRNALAAALITAVTVALGTGAYFARARRAPIPASQIRSLAVLSLENLSGDPQQDYFAEGVTEELTTTLAKVTGVTVLARTAVMRYKGTKKPPAEIARELGVQGLIEGSVLRSNGKVRITARLIDPASSTQLWADSYEGEIDNVLGLQAEVARGITSAISARLSPSNAARLGARHLVDPEAIDDYWKAARLLAPGESPDAPQQALLLLHAAIEKEPRFAQAYAAVALAYTYIGGGNFWGPDGDKIEQSARAFAKAEEAAVRALELDPTLAEAHYAIGIIRFRRYDWDGAFAADRMALQLNPNLTASHGRLALRLVLFGRHAEALVHARKARSLDPLSESLGLALFHSRRYDEAIEECRRVLDAGGPPGVRFTLARIYLRVKRYDEAMTAFGEGRTLQTMPQSSRGMRNAFAAGGDRGLAAWLAQFNQRQTYRPFGPWQLAWFYAMADDKERAFARLGHAYEQNSSSLNWSLADPGWDNIRSDRRFDELLRKMNLPESLMRVRDTE